MEQKYWAWISFYGFAHKCSLTEDICKETRKPFLLLCSGAVLYNHAAHQNRSLLAVRPESSFGSSAILSYAEIDRGIYGTGYVAGVWEYPNIPGNTFAGLRINRIFIGTIQMIKQMIKKAGFGLAGIIMGATTINAQTGDVSGRLQTPVGQVPYNVETFSASMQKMTGGETYQVQFNSDGSFEVLGLPNAISDNELLNRGHLIDLGGADAAANIQGITTKGLQQKNIQAQLFNCLGQAISIDEMNYDPSTGKLELFKDMTSEPAGIFIARINNGKGNIHTTKCVNNPNGDNTKRSATFESLEEIAKQEKTLKSSTPTGALQATDQGTAYRLIVDDPFDNLKDTTYNNILIFNNQTTNITPIIQYAKKATQNMVIRRSDGNLAENVPLIFSYNNDEEKRDTIWITSVPQIIEVDINKVGTNPTYEIPNGFEHENLPNPDIPFRSTTGSTTFTPGENQEKAYPVESYLEQQLILQLKNQQDTTQNVANKEVLIKYTFDNLVKYYTTDSDGKIYLDRKAEKDSIVIGIDSDENYLGRTTIVTNTGEILGGLAYNKVTRTNEETRIQKIMMLPYELRTGLTSEPTTITTTFNDVSQGYDLVNLQLANDTVNIYVTPRLVEQLNMTDQEMNAHLQTWQERLGIVINRVYENKNPNHFEAMTYEYKTNNFNSGDLVFTNTFDTSTPGFGGNATIYNTIKLNGNFVMYSSRASVVGGIEQFNKELWRSFGFDQTNYGEVSAEDGGLTMNVREGAIGRVIIELAKAYISGEDYSTPGNFKP